MIDNYNEKYMYRNIIKYVFNNTVINNKYFSLY